MKIFVSIISLIILALMGGLVFALCNSKPDEITGETVGAFSSLLGGLIGAAGAGIAVYLTLAGQRQEDKERVRSALVREVIEFSRLIVGHLETCENIRTKAITLPVNKFAESMSMPTPIIYPAVADKIGLLPSPQNVVAFYSRIAEAGICAQTVSNGPIGTAIIHEDSIKIMVDIWLHVLVFAQGIIENSLHDKTFDQAVQQSILKDIASQTTDARQKFKITE